MGNPVCVDTDIIIDYLRGKKTESHLYARIVTQEIPCTTYITKFELLCGARTTREETIIREALIGFIILPFDDKSSAEAAKIYRDLSAQGRLIGMSDILIAGIARANSMQLATRNVREFERVHGLKLWTP